jgi:hypothetical protein
MSSASPRSSSAATLPTGDDTTPDLSNIVSNERRRTDPKSAGAQQQVVVR